MKATIYTRPTCRFCRMAKAYLKKRKVKYREINASGIGIFKVIMKTGQLGVPVIEINGRTIVGFDKKAISKVLKK